MDWFPYVSGANAMEIEFSTTYVIVAGFIIVCVCV